MNVVDEDRIRELAAVQGRGAPVVSCYLDVDGRRLPRPLDVEHELERTLRRARANGNGAAVADDLDRIERFVRGGLDRSRTRGLAVFSCAADDLWEVVELPVSVRSQIVVGPAPALGQLEMVVEELRPVGVLLADRAKARVLVFEMGELTERSDLVGEQARDWDQKGEKERGDHAGHLDDLTHRHLRRAAEATWELFHQHEFTHLTVGAPDDLRSELEAALHPYLRERLAPPIGVPVGASVDEIRQAALRLEGEVERAEEAARVEELRAAAATGRGATGLAEVLGALSARRARLLLVSDGYEEQGWRCARCELLAPVGPACPACGSAMQALDDVVQEAVDVALAQSCRVEVCVGNADLDVLGRIGATFRY